MSRVFFTKSFNRAEFPGRALTRKLRRGIIQLQLTAADPEREGERMKSVVVYYSLSGNTAWVAGRIAEKLGAELLPVEPRKAYPARGAAKFFRGGKSAVFEETPPLKPCPPLPQDAEQVIFGFPVWAGNVAPPIRSFVKEYGDFLRGKTFAAFACQSGSGAEKALGKLRECLGAELRSALILIDPKVKPSEEKERQIAAFCESIK